MLKCCATMLALLTVVPIEAASQDLSSTTASTSLTGPSFLAVRVNDVATASLWYQEVFGLAEVNRIDADDGRYFIRILSGGGLSVELIEERDVEQPADRHLGLFKAGIYVVNIDAFHSRLEELGVDQDGPIFLDEALNARSFTFRDSEGNRLQAFQNCAARC